MEQRFGRIVDAMLVREGVVTDHESRWKVIEAVARDLTEAAEKLARNADGDYSPDTYVSGFPSPARNGDPGIGVIEYGRLLLALIAHR